ncbi:hypothetical protein [Pseudidiomarina sp. CB1]|uniref:hypothetical protein n=1 Tax=Pseudidiomarina sp. CB1 TaxID=2972484 RepID=UPI00216196DB|nr:hypothetical protein [Pseudidiomarina sp. CB1]
MKEKTISKTNYLSNSVVSEFIEYLYLVVTDKETLNLTFSVPKQNKEYPSDYWIDNPQRIVNYRVFNDALTEYFWAKESLEENKERLDIISAQLNDAISASSDEAFFKAVDDCLLWGAGYRKSASLYRNNIAWLESNFPTRAGVLSYFLETLEALLAEQVQLHAMPSLFRMNSGYTKVFALMSPSQFIIYDSRVAAGLGLLFIKFLHKRPIHSTELSNALGLRFLRQGVPARDPNVIFNIGMKAIYPSAANSSLHHAESNVRANWLLQAVEELVKRKGTKPEMDLRKMEAGLFMLGAQVGRPNGPILS